MMKPAYHPMVGHGFILWTYWAEVAGRDVLMAAFSSQGSSVRYLPYRDFEPPRQKELLL